MICSLTDGEFTPTVSILSSLRMQLTIKILYINIKQINSIKINIIFFSKKNHLNKNNKI